MEAKQGVICPECSAPLGQRRVKLTAPFGYAKGSWFCSLSCCLSWLVEAWGYAKNSKHQHPVKVEMLLWHEH